ncbi:MAG TPA: S-4TM family putative pore-forming effector [Novosphingobium sp.]
MNTIPARQNMESALKQLHARQWTYVIANRLMVAQIVLTVLVPITGAVLTLCFPAVRPHFAALALVVLVLDTVLLDRQYKAVLKRGAKLGEKFDSLVLGLPWNAFIAGDESESEDVYAAASAWRKRHTDEKLLDWYPIASGELPLALGRIVCQRTNLRYDSQLRRSYGTIILVTVGLVALSLIVVGLVQDLNMTAWVLTLAPATPLLSWAGREFYRQRDTAEQLEDLTKKARGFWKRALEGACDEDRCLKESRELQDAIYLRRSTSPLIIPFLYRIKRLGLEDQMNEAANNFLEEYRAKAGEVA